MSTINEAATRLTSTLNELAESPVTEEVAPEAEEEQPETLEAEAETTEEVEAEEAESDTEEAPRLLKVKIDGEEIEVPEDELIKGYSRESHYQAKMRELADQRKAVESKQEEIDRRLSEARAIVEMDIKTLESEEMQQLKEDDPEAYLKARERVEKKVDRFNKQLEKQAREAQEKQQKLIEKERKALLDLYPNWSDPEVMTNEAAELLKVMQSVGFSDEELQNMTDHRLFVLADKAKRLQAFEKADLEAKKVKPKPKTAKPGTPGTKEERVSADAKAMREKLKKTGSFKDAARLLTLR